jgi:cytochrome c oxidase cbb3-type subunit 4
MMDIGTLRGLGTLLVFVAFVGLVIWAYSSKRKKSFDEAANLPFADEQTTSVERDDEQASGSKSE